MIAILNRSSCREIPMERYLFIGSAIAAIIAWTGAGGLQNCQLTLLRQNRAWIALVPACMAFCIAMQTQKPFSEGLALGVGILAGSIAAACAQRIPTSVTAHVRHAGMVAPCIAATVIPFIFLRDGLIPGLTGVALGWCVPFVLMSVYQPKEYTAGIPVMTGLACTFTALIGVIRNDSYVGIPKDAWSLAPILLFAAIVVLRVFLAQVKGLATVASVAITFLLTIMALWVAELRVNGDIRFFAIGVGGFLVFAFAQTLIGKGNATSRYILASLLILAGDVVAAAELQNFGTGLFAAMFCAGALMLPTTRAAHIIVVLPTILAILRYTGLIPVSMTEVNVSDQIGVAALLVAILLPVYASETMRSEQRPTVRLLAVGALLLFVPSAVIVVLGTGSMAWFTVGTVVVCTASMLIRRFDYIPLLAICALLGLLTTFDFIDLTTDFERTTRLKITLAIMVIPTIILMFSESTRRFAKVQRHLP